ncbi:small GTP-binding protein domain [Vavraia culicis subsp. floridensis]|uniref:Elongation factor 2 n=1 Tax=Vavraia culicis (isolate floridensis) TaxID=948595 RepID=L2GS33_VAVCU|nr:small GTP-binding protein domain [Vavraia culicis subsp. floridensis]ELA46471.1 small GTP-binding protein domain [Vavraia culicis subsp. floridensis]
MAVERQMLKVQALMNNQPNIRNISVIAHVDHGKSTLTDCLVIKAKIASEDASGKRYMDTREDEQERGITIKSTAISMNFTMNNKVLSEHIKQPYNGNSFLINLIDSPGHVDFSSEVTAALRVTDGAVVVIDCVDGICVQTETVLRQAIAERIMPTVVLNKLDRALLELKESKVDLAAKLRRRVEDFNAKLQMICQGADDFQIESLFPQKNEISFCSGLQGWGFTLKSFAKYYVKQMKQDNKPNPETFVCKVLWSEGVYYSSDDPFDPEGKFLREGPPERTAFIVFVLNPIYRVKELCENLDEKGLREYLSKFDVTLPASINYNEMKDLFKIAMRAWLPASDMLLEQIILNLPSPTVAQKYRAPHLYTGPIDDQAGRGIATASTSPDDPCVMYVSKMVPYSENRFIAMGRVFSGVIKPGMKVRIQGPDYTLGSKTDLHVKTIQRTVVMMGRVVKDIDECPAGNIVGLIGIDSELKKTGTITTWDGCHNIKSMKFSVSPVVKYALRPENPVDLPKLKAGLIKLSKSDPLTQVNFSDNGELTLAGAGELHLEISLEDLRKEYACCGVVAGEPQVTYMEGISETVGEPKMSKSPNKHNRIFMCIEPMEEKLVENIESGALCVKDPKERSVRFREMMGIKDDWVKKILFYGPEDKGPNIVIDSTKGIAYLNEIKEYMREGFREVTARGPLIGEVLRGCRFDLMDCTLHSDAIHRTGNQISAPMTSVCKGLILAAEPILYEPIFLAEISVASDQIGGVNSVLSQRRGVAEEYKCDGGLRTTITGFLPVRESFGFNSALLMATRGEASVVLTFSHYSILPGSLSDSNSLLHDTVTSVRKKRGFVELKGADYYFDKL